MNARGGSRRRATRRPVVVVAGESRNDRKSLRILLQEFCPEMEGRVVEINDAIHLHAASDGTLAERVGDLARSARARAAREQSELACVFVHEDLDIQDGDRYPAARDRVQKALTSALRRAHYVLSVEEMEAWLLLFPAALAGLVSSWSIPKQYLNRDTGSMGDPKGILTREVSSRERRYRESDAPDVFAKAATLSCLDDPKGRNRSWTQLRTDVDDCCRLHLMEQREPQ